jgi:hypothetical protein
MPSSSHSLIYIFAALNAVSAASFGVFSQQLHYPRQRHKIITGSICLLNIKIYGIAEIVQ